MTEPVDSPRQQLRERIDFCIPTAVVTWPTPYDRRYGELDAGDRTAIVDAILAALVEAGWGPTAAHEEANGKLLAEVLRLRAALREAGGPEYEQVGWFGEHYVTGQMVLRPIGSSFPFNHGCEPVFRKVTPEATHEAGQPTPPRCPTCLSPDPDIRRKGCGIDVDPWHAGQP